MADVKTIYFITRDGKRWRWKCERGADVTVDPNMPYVSIPTFGRNVQRIILDNDISYEIESTHTNLGLYIDVEVLRYVFVPCTSDSKKQRIVWTRYSRINGGLQHLFEPRICMEPDATDTFTQEDVIVANRGHLAIVGRNVSVKRCPLLKTTTSSTTHVTTAAGGSTTVQQHRYYQPRRYRKPSSRQIK